VTRRPPRLNVDGHAELLRGYKKGYEGGDRDDRDASDRFRVMPPQVQGRPGLIALLPLRFERPLCYDENPKLALKFFTVDLDSFMPGLVAHVQGHNHRFVLS